MRGKREREKRLAPELTWARYSIAKVKAIVPPQQLKVCRLEDGFGWDEVCPYLGVPVPEDAEWPSRNAPEEFFQLSDKALKSSPTKAVVLASVLAPLVAVGIWYARSGGRGLPKLF